MYMYMYMYMYRCYMYLLVCYRVCRALCLDVIHPSFFYGHVCSLSVVVGHTLVEEAKVGARADLRVEAPPLSFC